MQEIYFSAKVLLNSLEIYGNINTIYRILASERIKRTAKYKVLEEVRTGKTDERPYPRIFDLKNKSRVSLFTLYFRR